MVMSDCGSEFFLDDDGIRVRGDDAIAPLASTSDDCLGGEEMYEISNVCRMSSFHRNGSNQSSREYVDTVHECECQPSAAEAREFRKRWLLLTDVERTSSLRADASQFLQTVTDLLPCLGCRGGTEALFQKLVAGSVMPLALIADSGLCFDKKGKQFRLDNAHMANPDLTLTRFLHQDRWGNAVLAKYNRSLGKSASSRVRCPLHSQRTRGRPRPAAFEALWKKLPDEHRRYLSQIDSEQFLNDLENYLRRHRFCCRCKEKVLEAYDLLIGTSCSEDDCEDCAGFDCGDTHHDRGDYGDELHYTSYLFDELTYSRATNQIVVPCQIDFMSQLMTRADQEIVGDWGDRHARTISEAQDEVLTCLGIVIWERMQTLWTKSRTEKRAEELLVHCAVATLRRNFDIAVEALHGKEMMEQLLAEEDDESRRLAKKKEKRKEKKKKRKTATKLKQADRSASEQSLNSVQASGGAKKKKQVVSSTNSNSKTMSMSSTMSSPTHSVTSSQGDENENENDNDLSDNSDIDDACHQCTPSCDDECSLKQLSIDEQREMQLLSSMGWNASEQSGLSFPATDDYSDDGIPEDEIEFWKRNRSVLASKRLAQRQNLQEKFDQFVLRSNSIPTETHH